MIVPNDAGQKPIVQPLAASQADPNQTRIEEQSVRRNVSAEKTGAQPAFAKSEIDVTRADIGGPTDAAHHRTQALTDEPAARTDDCPERLGGYRIIGELGRGAMGAVYLARQVSLDRLCALKVIQTKWSHKKSMVARFMREAYAAAQLVHHNVIQVYDFGRDRDTNFFSMEYVRGLSLWQVVKKEGILDSQLAATYILQAARGLQCAHNQGMVHRDVKPGNLMLNEDGVVKVADLGLVKVPLSADIEDETEVDFGMLSAKSASASVEITQANRTVGTAAYMAPEQAVSAKNVDHRADIYSLGCTFYVLLTGKAPFSGDSALEVISKHKTEEIIRPDVVIERIPKDVSEIVLKMVAKRPEDRYSNMGAVISAIEEFLGVQTGASYSPKEEHVVQLEKCAAEYNNSKTAKLTKFAGLGFVGLSMLAFFGSIFFSPYLAFFGILTLSLSSALAYFLLKGIRDGTHMFDVARQYVINSRFTDWLTWVGALFLFGVIAYFLGGWIYTLVAVPIGIGLGVGFYFLCDLRIKKERASAIGSANHLLKTLRIKGIEEGTIRQFVAKYSGNEWEELFEELFGYTAKRVARLQLQQGGLGKGKRKFRAWRDLVVDWIEQRNNTRREVLEKKRLQKIEADGLKEQGLSAVDAQAQAEKIAAELVKDALQSKLGLSLANKPVDPEIVAAKKRARIKQMLIDARGGKQKEYRSIWQKLDPILGPFLGAKIRFAFGCMLVIGCVMWMDQNGLIPKEVPVDSTAASTQANNLAEEISNNANEFSPLKIFGLPVPYFDSFNPGVAGVVLILLAFFRGWRISLFAIPAAFVMVLLPSFGIPPAFGLKIPSLAAGTLLYLMAVGIGRDR